MYIQQSYVQQNYKVSGDLMVFQAGFFIWLFHEGFNVD